jgi:hypothetical protein
LPRAERSFHRQSAAHRQPSEPKNTFAHALTRYLKTPYDEKTKFFHTAYPRGRDTLFLQLVIPQPLTMMPKRPKPSRLTQNYPTLEPQSPPPADIDIGNTTSRELVRECQTGHEFSMSVPALTGLACAVSRLMY